MNDFDDRMNSEGDAFGRRPVLTSIKWGLAGIAVVLVLTVVISLISTGGVFFNAARAKVTAGARVTTKVYDPNNIVNQVNFFTSTCEAVGKDDANWKANKGQLETEQTLARDARTQGEAQEASSQASQAATFVAGALEQLQSDAAEYNARSINYTANPFKTAGLPYRITVPSIPAELNQWAPPSCG